MPTKTQLFSVSLLLASQAFHHVLAQEAKPNLGEPKTKLEAFQAKSGAVIVRGFSEVGVIKGKFSGLLVVSCMEFAEASSGKREYGLTVTVKTDSRVERERESTSFIDYDEIESLIKGIELIAKIEKGTTKLASFQADYKTSGNLKVSTFSDVRGGVEAVVQSGSLGGTSLFFTLSDLEQFRKLILESKEMLDEIRK